MATNPYESIVGKYFECQNQTPLPRTSCPSLSKLPNYSGPEFDTDTGEWSCPKCLAIVDRDNEEEDGDMFDEDEDEAFDNDEAYTPEGESIQDQSDEEKLRVKRQRDIDLMVAILYPYNLPFAKYMDENKYLIVDQLRILEEAQEAGFEFGPGISVRSKLLALTIHLSGLGLRSQEIRLLGQRQGAVDLRLKILKALATNLSDHSPMVEKLYYVGKGVGLSKNLIDIMIEQFEEASPLPNKESDLTTKAAAWIYIQSKAAGIKKITKGSLNSVPLVKKNSLNRAIESYQEGIQKRIKPVEGVNQIHAD